MNIDIVKVANFNSNDVVSYNIRNSKGFGVNVLNFGGIITDILVPDRNGIIGNIVTKYKNIDTYKENPSFFGSLIGRTSGRICNGEVELEGKLLKFNKNYGLHQCHGGDSGFGKKFLDANTNILNKEATVEFKYHSEDNEEGYPGNVDIVIRYTITEENELKISYSGISDETTLLNLTNHSYFNLGGKDNETVLDHYLYVDGDFVVEIDSTSVPTGKLMGVEGTPFDFTLLKTIGKDINEDHEQISMGGGYDHPWILKKGQQPKLKLYHELSGRVMEVYTNQSAVVLYSMNFPDNELLENGKKANKRAAIAIETQSPPIGRDNCFVEESILRTGEEYNKETIYKFSIK